MILVSAEEISFGRYGHWRQVGHGEVTNEFCGRYWGIEGCLNERGHKGIHRVNGKVVDTTDVGAFRIVHRHCGRPSCPKCAGNWVYESSNRASLRIEEGSKILGKPEHGTISVPVSKRDLVVTREGYLKLRAEAVKVLYNRGFNGFGLVFHAFRYGVFSPHWHFVGFAEGGYTCRNCKHTKEMCLICDGVHGREARGFKVDGWLVKVFGERRSVLQTLHYELGHASYFDNVRSFRVVTWHGTMGYRKLHVVYVKNRVHCPICGCEFRRVRDLARLRALITDVTNPCFHREFFSMLFDSRGVATWEYFSTSAIVPFDFVR